MTYCSFDSCYHPLETDDVEKAMWLYLLTGFTKSLILHMGISKACFVEYTL